MVLFCNVLLAQQPDSLNPKHALRLEIGWYGQHNYKDLSLSQLKNLPDNEQAVSFLQNLPEALFLTSGGTSIDAPCYGLYYEKWNDKGNNALYLGVSYQKRMIGIARTRVDSMRQTEPFVTVGGHTLVEQYNRAYLYHFSLNTAHFNIVAGALKKFNSPGLKWLEVGVEVAQGLTHNTQLSTFLSKTSYTNVTVPGNVVKDYESADQRDLYHEHQEYKVSKVAYTGYIGLPIRLVINPGNETQFIIHGQPGYHYTFLHNIQASSLFSRVAVSLRHRFH